MPKKSNLNLQDFGPVSSFSTSIISGLLVGLLIQSFIGYEPIPIIVFVLIGIYDGFRRMWQISKKLEGKK
jgi:F0F1-type ATP synthase assembly protein I